MKKNKKKKLNGFQMRQRKLQMEKNKLQKESKTLPNLNGREVMDMVNTMFENGVSMKDIKRWEGMMYQMIAKPHLNKTTPTDMSEVTPESIKKLPHNVRRHIRKLLQMNKPQTNRCWFVSNKLSLDIEGVDVVDGWYGNRDMIGDYISKRENRNHTLEYSDCGKWIISRDNESYFHKDMKISYKYDIENGISWTRHSWNKYGDIHFDVSKEGNPSMNNINYIYTQIDITKRQDVIDYNVKSNGIFDMNLIISSSDSNPFNNGRGYSRLVL